MNIPELHEIENTDFVDEMTAEECNDYLFDKLSVIEITFPMSVSEVVVEVVMPDGDTFTGCGGNHTVAMQDVTKQCIDHYLLIN